MSKSPRYVPRDLGIRIIKSWSMLVTMSYMSAYEQLTTQHLCLWFYKYGTSRVQITIRLRWPN